MRLRAVRSGSGGVLALAMAIGVLAVPGGASVQRVLGEADCAAILAVGEDFADTETLDQLQSADLKAAAKGFASSATQVDDADVKRALKKISKTLKKAANAGSTTKAAAALTNQGYISAIQTWTTQAAQCEMTSASG